MTVSRSMMSSNPSSHIGAHFSIDALPFDRGDVQQFVTQVVLYPCVVEFCSRCSRIGHVALISYIACVVSC